MDVVVAPSEPHRVAIEDLLTALGSEEMGLTAGDAARRLDAHGSNELRVRQDVPEILRFLAQFRNFFALLLLMGGGLALIAERLDPGQGNLYIAIALIAVVVLNAGFTYLQERQSERIMDSFRRMLPSMARVIRDGETQLMEASRLVPGDIIYLLEGDRVPADARLLEANGLKVDLSSLTGESEPQHRDPDTAAAAIIDSPNMVFSGTLVQTGNAKAVICATGMATEIGRIVQLTKETKAVETPIHRELRYFIKVISTIAIVLGVLFFAISVAIGKGEIVSLIFAIGIIVANVPEGLLPTVTLALTMTSKRMARKNALIKDLESVETLGSTTVICTDKTGTLTQNRLSVTNLVLDGRSYAANDPGLPTSPSFGMACKIMARCNDAKPTDYGFTGDATEVALLDFVEAFEDGRGPTARRVAEKPFESAVKHMTTVCEADHDEGFEAYLKGAPEVVLDLSSRVMLGGVLVPLTPALRGRVMENYSALARGGERGLGLAYRETGDPEPPQGDYVFTGIVGMIDPPRPEVPAAIETCHAAGIRVFMLTGDYGLTAEAIARDVGLIRGEGTIIQGADLAAMTDEELMEALKAPDIVFARISPAQKLRIVQALQACGETVTVTGDGVNDAPALKNADMGVAMGMMGTDVAKEAANMVLMDDNFATIVAAVEEGRTIFENIKKFVAYILTSNVPQILPFIAYVLLDIPLPLTVVLILSIDLGTDLLPALGLGVEPPETDLMHKPPRSRGERLLSRNLLLMSYGWVGMAQAAAGFFCYFYILYDGGWQWGQELANTDPLYRTAITGFFAAVIICQVSDVIICRTRRQSLLSVGVLTNRLVLLGIATELALLALISYLPACNVFFGTAPLKAEYLALSLPFALFILLADEGRRVFVRRENPFVLRWLTW